MESYEESSTSRVQVDVEDVAVDELADDDVMGGGVDVVAELLSKKQSKKKSTAKGATSTKKQFSPPSYDDDDEPVVDDGDDNGEAADDDEYADQADALPEQVRQFLQSLSFSVSKSNVSQVSNLYEQQFSKITDRHFKSAPWPRWEVVQHLVAPNEVFQILYKELYYRHLYSRHVSGQPNVRQRIESWRNYSALFERLIKHADERKDIKLDLPQQWLYDIIDEFVYQFQSFCQYQANLKNKSDNEFASLKANPEVWHASGVLRLLDGLVSRSRIVEQLDAEQRHTDWDPEGEGFEASTHPLYYLIGYFALIGQMRVHCLLGDYTMALRSISAINLGKKGLYARVLSAYITLFYYAGFAYMMLRRYKDATRCFTSTLLHLSRVRQYQTRSLQYDQISKMNERMYGLLAVCVVLCPQRIEESLHSTLRDKYGDHMLRMQRGDDSQTAFQEIFYATCPKFVWPSPPDFDNAPRINLNQEPVQLQLKLFLREVEQQAILPVLRSYLKLYTSLSLTKLAAYLDMEKDDLLTMLLAIKHKTTNPIWSHGAPLSGNMRAHLDIDFYLDEGEMIHVVDTRSTSRYGEYFLRHLQKFNNIVESGRGR